LNEPKRSESTRKQSKKKLEDSPWLRKFKQIGDDLREVKTKVPLTQLCELKWLIEDDSLLIHCPNLEVRSDLQQQIDMLAKTNISARYLTIKYPETPDITINIAIDRS
jgi:hypothetical protein